MAMKPSRNAIEGNTGMATNGHSLWAKALHEFRAGIFRDVEFLAAGHAIEDRPRLIDGDEIEIDAVRLHLAGIERLHPIVERASKRQLQLGHGRDVLPVIFLRRYG